jgi:hypothetical protein
MKGLLELILTSRAESQKPSGFRPIPHSWGALILVYLWDSGKNFGGMIRWEKNDLQKGFNMRTANPERRALAARKKRIREANREQRFEIVRKVLTDLYNNHNEARCPDPEESIPFLTDKHGWGRFIWVRDLEFRFKTLSDFIEFTILLRKIGGIKKARCPKCSTDLPVIKTVNSDRYRHTYYQWQTYCPWCSWIQPVRKDEDLPERLKEDPPLPRFKP